MVRATSQAPRNDATGAPCPRRRPLRRHRARAIGYLLAAVIGLAAPVAETGGTALAADAPPAGAQSQPSREYLIKAAILYNFAKFTRWPSAAFARSDGRLRLCILGTDPFGEALATIEGKQVDGRALQTVRISGIEEIEGCHMLFVADSAEVESGPLFEAVSGQPVLTVAQSADFARGGGVLSLTTEDDRCRFDVNVTAAERAGLKLSAKLLRLAGSVIRE